MNILGLHFGHDAGACIVRDGVVVSCVLRKHISRIKHAISLYMAAIDLALSESHLSARDIDLVVITSTQDIELIIDWPLRLSITFADHPDHSEPCQLKDWIKYSGKSIDRLLEGSLLDVFFDGTWYDTLRYHPYRHYFPDHRGLLA